MKAPEWLAPLVTFLIAAYIMLSLAGSMLRIDMIDLENDGNERCYKTYPIDYVLYTKLFCEAGESNGSST